MRFWIGVSAAFGAGTLIGIGLGTLLVEDKLKKEYEESAASMRRAYEALRIDAETPPLDRDEVVIKPTGDGVILEGGTLVEVSVEEKADPSKGVHPVTVGRPPFDELDQPVPQLVTDVPQTDNPYHVAVEKTHAVDIYASFAELSEDDYFEDDGREKEQITMIYSDNEPIFFMGGSEIDDAFERVGGTIVDDMRESVREGKPFLYVRNNQTDTDYEVVFEQP